jgi:carboxyl-terminal processing protease
LPEKDDRFMVRKRHALIAIPLIILVFTLLGGFFGPQVPVASAATDATEAADPADRIPSREVDTFARFYAVVDQNFADPLKPEKAIYRGAIPGMLRTLDPHSNFFDPKDYQSVLEDQRGVYSGIGMQVSARNGKTVVIAPFPGSPAYKVGMRPGDIILFVNDKSTDGLNTTEVADLLKGPRGTEVKVVVSREGAPDYLSFNLIRDQIDRKSVPDAVWARPGIAYIKILQFGENTGRELDENLKRLGEQNLKGLVLDLRGNPGGLLNAGVAVADKFLQKGQIIVSHHGRSSPERPYLARNGNHGNDYPIVVLVDRSSASAAEIVAGALQDHDRGWILGEQTFGKGLVQTVFPLRDRTALALTTAHFYTPSGRLIQRDFTNKSFYEYYYNRGAETRNELDVKMTDSGRRVYGGGGITPDEKYESPKLDHLQIDLLRTSLFTFSRAWFVKHRDPLPKGWMPSEQILEELHEYLLTTNVKFTEAEWTQHHDWIRRYLAKEMYIHGFNVDESDRMFAQTDPEVARAIDAMPKAEALVDKARKIAVQRMR